jgi:light-regulated signal transduction histidine kinase (bacteriophytochrome)
MSEQELESARLDAEDRLRRANADFQEFTSRLCHDLREPLRTISTYSQLFVNRMAASPDPDAALSLQYIQDAVGRAQALLAAVMEYSSIESGARRLVPVDLNVVFAEAVRREGHQQAYSHDELPRVVGDFDLLSRLFRHLFENAIKFANRPDPSVHVSAFRKDYDWVISVHDNGPGIDPAHQETVFGLFKRLHGRDFSGSGLGLAFCRKAIESLGGRIWLESSPGEGATFLFSLPAAED